jgi:serine/threonine protein kinase
MALAVYDSRRYPHHAGHMDPRRALMPEYVMPGHVVPRYVIYYPIPVPKPPSVVYEKCLGRGTFAEVWQGRLFNPTTNRYDPVAIKKHFPPTALNDTYGASRNEAYMLSKVSACPHPFLARLIKAEEYNAGTFSQHLIMTELVEGVDLYKIIADRSIRKNIFIINKIAKQILQLLDYSSFCKIVHADLKPENVMIEALTFNPKVVDWGLAHFENRCDYPTHSLFYRPLEKILKLEGSHTCLGDVWSLGCILYETYIGKALFAFRAGADLDPETFRGMLHLMEKKLGCEIPVEWIDKMQEGLRRDYFDKEEFCFGDVSPYSVKEPYLEHEAHASTSIDEDIMRSAIAKGDDLEKAKLLADLIKKMLKFDGRPSARKLLETHPFFRY